MEVKIYNSEGLQLPQHAKKGDAGQDLRAVIKSGVEHIGKLSYKVGENKIYILPQTRVKIPTGLHIELPVNYEAQIRPRSGHAFKTGLTVVFGTIDSNYRGEILISVANFTNNVIEIEHGERIAQLVIGRYKEIEWKEVNKLTELGETDRGSGGFGSSGKK